MVAIDQRESLRTMIHEATGSVVDDQTVSDFKVGVASNLGPLASAMLFDRQFGLPAFHAAADTGCGRILAVDRLIQVPGEIVTDTALDESVNAEALRSSGAVALKFLVLWKGDENADACVDAARRFVELSTQAGLIAILEAMVRLPSGVDEASWDRDGAIVEAATALSATGPALYKSDVPTRGQGSVPEIAAWSERISEALSCPWVVLSNGVTIEDFPQAIEGACRGGASGFLAGRAVWADCVGVDYDARLAETSVPRLRSLVQIVDRHARPWQGAVDAAM
jgi:sulfofructosephosphate aldolase